MSKQQQVPGTERPADPDMERAAEALRLKRKERMDTQQVETQLSADLEAVVQKRIDSGAITIPPGASEEVPVFRYLDGEGTERVVKVKLGMKIKVNVAKD